MFQKQNQEPVFRKDRKGLSSKLSGEGNDFVLKRYRLEENKLFKQKHIEDLHYEVKGDKKMTQEQEDFEDELVIVPLELSRCKEIDLPEQEEPQVDTEHQDIIVFDDEEDGNIQQADEDLELGTQNSSHFYREGHLVSSVNSPQLLTAKPLLNDNWSAAELMTPSPKQFFQGKNEPANGKVLEKIMPIAKQKKLEQQEDDQGIENIKGVKIAKENGKNISITITDKKIFSISKLPTGIILKCKIKRTSSLLSLMSPEFDLYLANGLKHIVSAKKYPLRNRELFKFSVDPLKFEGSSQIAVMHANQNHNIYWVLDQPRRIGDSDLSLIYLVVGYYKLKSDEKQRRFTTLLPPTSNEDYQLAINYEMNNINFSNIKEEIQAEISNLMRWKNQSFNSTKNFVLADEDDPDYRYIEMKKESDDVFELSIQHPFSPLQAMAIAMTRFDVQLK